MAKQEPPKEHTMQLAEILSDLVSLRVCDPNAALALVSARPSIAPPHQQDANAQTSTEVLKSEEEDDVDLKRAKDLLKLHYEVKEAHKRGELSRGLEEARWGVERAVGG
ncbi:Nn.00g057570.m01.CDS01 [Neocucurbitaria sp. VM-36]